MSTVSRKSKWHPTPPPPPSPKILHFPRSRRTRRRRKPNSNTNPINQHYLSLNGSTLFDQDNHHLHGLPLELLSSLERREKVEEREEQEEKWKFQASGRRKIVESKNENAAVEEEIQDLSLKLEELQNSSRIKDSEGGSCSNFRLQNHHNKSTHDPVVQESQCSGRCKAIVLRIVEQVRAETEQWSQMQTMLEQVRGEMEELQASRNYWESRAHASECEIQSLRHSVEEWREKALDYEKQVKQLQLKLSSAKEKMHKAKLDLRRGENNVVLDNLLPPPVPLGAQLVKERRALHKNYHKHEKDHLFLEEMNIEENKTRTPKKDTGPLSLAKQLAKEKRSLIQSFKENRRATKDKGSKEQEVKDDGRSRRYSNIGGVALNRSPLRDIGNSSPPLARQNHRAAFVYDSPESSRIRESFRK